MITINVTILLAFSLLPKITDKKKKSKKGKKGKKSKSSGKSSSKSSKKSSKSSKKGKKGKKQRKKPELPPHVLDVGKPIGYAHVEYVLIPGRPKYQFDVICWNSVAKVYCVDGTLSLRIRVKENYAWVPVCIQHHLNQLSIDNLIKLHKHVIVYTIATSKKKLGASAKKDKVKKFYIYVEDVDSDQFVRAYEMDPNDGKSSEDRRKELLEEEMLDIILQCANKPGRMYEEEIVSHFNYFKDLTHDFLINKIITEVAVGKLIECKDFVPIPPPPSTEEVKTNKTKKKDKNKKGKKGGSAKSTKSTKSTKSKKSVKSKKGKSKKQKPRKTKKSVLKISIPGEVLYTDPNLSIYTMEDENDNIRNGFVLTSIVNLMTRTQKYLLNPLIVKIKKISNLPVEILQEHGFKRVYAHFDVPYVAQCTTKEKDLVKTIKINEAHAYFTDKIPKPKLIEFLQTQRLLVEICGVREATKQSPANIFGKELKDNELSRRLTPKDCMEKLKNIETPAIVTLAVACYDLSSLLKPTWDYLGKHTCHHPDSMLYKNQKKSSETFDYTDAINMNEINLKICPIVKNFSPIFESVLTEFGTTLKVEAFLSAPLISSMKVKILPDIFQRMMIISSDQEIVCTLLNEILLHNQEWLGSEIVCINYLRSIQRQVTTVDSQKSLFPHIENELQVITGFMIDNGNSFAFFLEGLHNRFISTIWQQFMHFNETRLKIFFNSDYIFEKRLYKEFIAYGGFYTVTLQSSLENIMAQEGIYLEGNVPFQCWEALKKLNLLFKCRTSRIMSQQHLFPTGKQLVSLDFEFGLPLRNQIQHSQAALVPMPVAMSEYSSPTTQVTFK